MIYHVDINAYFATMMQQENPSLRGKPVGIVKGRGRSCIIASSNEAKKYGIKTGCRVKDARLLYPNIILVPAPFDIFLASTHKLKEVFTSLSPDVSIFSLDEAFLTMTGCEPLMRQLLGKECDDASFGRFIQTKIKEKLGEWVQCNVGISHNHLLAKLASEISPKGAVFMITDQNVDEVLSSASFGSVCGVGYRLEKKLAILGATTPYHINLLDDETLLTHFGPFWASELRKIGLGQETHFFTHEKKVQYMQSVGRSFTVFSLCDNEDDIQRTILNLLEEAAAKMRKMNLAGRSVGLSLRGRDKYWSKYIKLGSVVRHTNEIFDLLYYQSYRQWKRTFPIVKFSVYIGNLQPYNTVPLSLLPAWNKQEKVYEAMDSINARFGLFTLKPATLLGKNIIKPEVTGFLGDKTYYGL